MPIPGFRLVQVEDRQVPRRSVAPVHVVERLCRARPHDHQVPSAGGPGRIPTRFVRGR